MCVCVWVTVVFIYMCMYYGDGLINHCLQNSGYQVSMSPTHFAVTPHIFLYNYNYNSLACCSLKKIIPNQRGLCQRSALHWQQTLWTPAYLFSSWLRFQAYVLWWMVCGRLICIAVRWLAAWLICCLESVEKCSVVKTCLALSQRKMYHPDY